MESTNKRCHDEKLKCDNRMDKRMERHADVKYEIVL